jgi:ubiquinone/menaquinone biosynthesis C-methylase UbiE
MMPQSSNFHASDGAAYELWLGRWSRRLANVFLDFVEFSASGELLDVGCGTGALTFAMADRWPGRRVIGVDVAAPFISYAWSRRSGDQPTFETGDACALNYQDGRFAGVAAHLVFLFIPKPEVALREMRRVTRSGGTVAAVVVGLARRPRVSAHALGHRSRNRCQCSRRPRQPVRQPGCHSGRVGGLFS